MRSGNSKEKELCVSQIIRNIFEIKAHETYFGEDVTQLQHAVQAYQLAREKNADLELCIAAFLHDIGHMVADISDDLGAEDHDIKGAEWLRDHGFSDRIIAVVKEHVNAKRYLCQRYPNYFQKLSDASRSTLQLQGGIMTETEAKVFETKPFFEDIIMIRLWDEQAKNKDVENFNAELIYPQIDQLFT